MHIKLIKEGKEYNQAVGYLEDGTMVVVEDARRLIGQEVKVKVKDTAAILNADGCPRFHGDTFGGDWPIQQWLDQDHSLHAETLGQRIHDLVAARYAEREQAVGPEVMRHVEKAVMLQTLDTQWKDHLAAMDYLRQGIHLRGYAQKNPKQEYKREAFELFSQLLDVVKMEVTRLLMTVRIQSQEQVVQAAEYYLLPLHDGTPPGDPGTGGNGSRNVGLGGPAFKPSQNSNTYIGYLLRRAGVKHAAPDRAVGWDTKPHFPYSSDAQE
jgi:hypothetical protein